MRKLLLFNLILASISLTTMSFGQRVTPQLSGSKCYFQVANVYFEVDPTYGGRISSLKLDNNEILYVDNSGDNYGSTFWPSPQSAWGWPPSVPLNSQAYSGGIQGDFINILSQADNSASYKLKFRKVFSANLSDTSITIDYYMFNTGTSAKSFAPWEITRVPVGGMSFFPDSGSLTGILSPAFERIGDLQWINYTGTLFPGGNNKIFGNCKEGWIAWINSDSAIFIKKFKNIQASEAAAGESEVEYYYNGPGTYYEIEDQGAYTSIGAKDSLKWTVKWYVRKVSDTVDTSIGSVKLANFVRNILKYADTATTHNSIKKKITGEKIILYPNPVSRSISISGLYENSTLILTDISGRNVFSAKIRSGQNIISLNSLNNGIYLYNIYSSNTKYSGKLIIQR